MDERLPRLERLRRRGTTLLFTWHARSSSLPRHAQQNESGAISHAPGVVAKGMSNATLWKTLSPCVDATTTRAGRFRDQTAQRHSLQPNKVGKMSCGALDAAAGPAGHMRLFNMPHEREPGCGPDQA